MASLPFLSPHFTRADISALTRTLRSGWLVLGKETACFEREFADYLGVREAVLTNSATTSLHLSLLAAGVGPGDEVVTTPLSYVSTANAIVHAGARPVFVDVDSKTGLLDLSRLAAAFTARTRAVIPVHLWGLMVDMKRLRAICDPRRIVVVEDAAHAIESERGGIKPGQRSVAACFSFHVSKSITSGEGGCIATNDRAIAAKLRLLRRDGIVNTGFTRRMKMLGYKCLSTDFQAALLRSQLQRIDKTYLARKRVHDTYERLLRGAGFEMPGSAPDARHAHLFCILLARNRFEVMAHLKEHEIETAIHYEPIHLEPYFRKTYGFKRGDFPSAEEIGGRVLSLPLHGRMTEKDVRRVVFCLKQVLSPARRTP
jgi:dTDP-4-amino-4,6-dideoxygalactose transaminase